MRDMIAIDGGSEYKIIHKLNLSTHLEVRNWMSAL